MIDALNKVGVYSLSDSGLNPENFDDQTILFAENPKSSENYKKVLKIIVNSDKKPFSYEGIELEDLSSEKIKYCIIEKKTIYIKEKLKCIMVLGVIPE